MTRAVSGGGGGDGWWWWAMTNDVMGADAKWMVGLRWPAGKPHFHSRVRCDRESRKQEFLFFSSFSFVHV